MTILTILEMVAMAMMLEMIGSDTSEDIWQRHIELIDGCWVWGGSWMHTAEAESIPQNTIKNLSYIINLKYTIKLGRKLGWWGGKI